MSDAILSSSYRPTMLVEWQTGSSGTQWEKLRDSNSLEPTITIPAEPFRTRPVSLTIAMWLIILAAAWITVEPWRHPSHFVTPAGEQRTVALADGSILNLNGDSEAQIKMTARERRVILAYGEARLTVAKEPGRPFFVSSPQATVQAFGTVFSVRALGKATTVTVLEGHAMVLPPVIDEISGAPSAPPKFLSAGQRALVTAEGKVTVSAS
jgi:ferric-dicitrate binding protein FerR (iron transport regulator)